MARLIMFDDINDRIPKIPGMKWGALFNYRPHPSEIMSFIKNPPLPEDGRWHSIITAPPDNGVFIDGKYIKRTDDSLLT